MPFSPRGKAGIVASPPWHYVGNFLAIDFWAKPEAVEALLPPGLELSLTNPGRCTANFVDWQFTSDEGDELLDPIRSQYHEFLLLVHANYEGQSVMYCPYIYVDQDASLMRGLIQGYPKKIGSVYTTRTFNIPSKASAPLRSGGVFAGTLAVKDRRLAEGVVQIENEASARPVAVFGSAPVITMRHFPSLEAGRENYPAVYELTRAKPEDTAISEIWQGSASLRFYDTPTEDLKELEPVEVNAGYRYTIAFTLRNNWVVKDLRESCAFQHDT
ncbi:acetoacetate decarboxylase [Scytonema hofmannii PCC 7110]|uniref:Acetoacetate decarboxylase n=2 Tax=Scytonema hofmannii TaxID=34078 RepID=A0A139X2Q9_9CYAN|nr:acetoacetate decarboxylase [Scytonema hofmannii PCC 7110]